MKRAFTIAFSWCLVATAAKGQTQSNAMTVNLPAGEMRLTGRPLVLVHGLISSPGVWDVLRNEMTNDGWAIHTPTLDGQARFQDNKWTLETYLNQAAIGSDAVLFGHSMGGITAREVSRSHQYSVVATVGTPHGGAPAARALSFLGLNNPFIRNAENLVYYKWRLDQIPVDGGVWANEWINAAAVDEARDRGYNAWQNLVLLNGPGALITLARAGFRICAAIDDLSYGSEAIALLRDSTWKESSSIKATFTASLNAGYFGHMFTLIMDPVTADDYGGQMWDDGYYTYMAGWTLEMAGAFYGDPDMVFAGFAIMDLGAGEMNFWQWWGTQIIGGFPNDGVVPVWSMQDWSGSTVYDVGYAKHTEETSRLAPQIRARINVIANQ